MNIIKNRKGGNINIVKQETRKNIEKEDKKRGTKNTDKKMQ